MIYSFPYLIHSFIQSFPALLCTYLYGFYDLYTNRLYCNTYSPLDGHSGAVSVLYMHHIVIIIIIFILIPSSQASGHIIVPPWAISSSLDRLYHYQKRCDDLLVLLDDHIRLAFITLPTSRYKPDTAYSLSIITTRISIYA